MNKIVEALRGKCLTDDACKTLLNGDSIKITLPSIESLVEVLCQLEREECAKIVDEECRSAFAYSFPDALAYLETAAKLIRLRTLTTRKSSNLNQNPMTYKKNQPTDNVHAWRLGQACSNAANEPKCGDLIDRGLILLRELELKGYGIVKLEQKT